MKHGSIPPTQDATPGMKALANLLKEEEPRIYADIMKLKGNPRIYEVAYGYDDHIKFIVTAGFGHHAIRAIIALDDNARVDLSIIRFPDWVTDYSQADIITWWA